jgi:hypothetical protein
LEKECNVLTQKLNTCQQSLENSKGELASVKHIKVQHQRAWEETRNSTFLTLRKNADQIETNSIRKRVALTKISDRRSPCESQRRTTEKPH